MGKLNREEVKVEVDNIEISENDNYKVIKFLWMGNIGFGEYTLYEKKEEPGKWYGDSECMDTTEDKWFLSKLLESFVNQIEVTD